MPKRTPPIPARLPEGLLAFRERRYAATAHWQAMRDLRQRHRRRPPLMSARDMETARLTEAPSACAPRMKVKEAIGKLGGIAVVAGDLGEKRSTVSMWGVRDSVPADAQLPFWRLCLARGVGWEPPGAEALRAELGVPRPAATTEAA